MKDNLKLLIEIKNDIENAKEELRKSESKQEILWEQLKKLNIKDIEDVKIKIKQLNDEENEIQNKIDKLIEKLDQYPWE